MTAFFSVGHNSNYNRGFPWISEIVEGLHRGWHCDQCGVDEYYTEGDLRVRLESKKGTMWPDVLGCGHHPLFIVSGRVLEDWRRDGIGSFPARRLEFAPPLPIRLQDIDCPTYFWIDGDKLLGAKLDFDASGIVDNRFCPGCGTRADDICKTYERQHSAVWPFTFVPGTWNGANLFTTDLSSAAFFCTDKVVDCGRQHRHTNFRFIPVEEGHATSSKGLQYLR
jgi:hypothetical protein